MNSKSFSILSCLCLVSIFAYSMDDDQLEQAFTRQSSCSSAGEDIQWPVRPVRPALEQDNAKIWYGMELSLLEKTCEESDARVQRNEIKMAGYMQALTQYFKELGDCNARLEKREQRHALKAAQAETLAAAKALAQKEQEELRNDKKVRLLVLMGRRTAKL